jgi:hypothetical protein
MGIAESLLKNETPGLDPLAAQVYSSLQRLQRAEIWQLVLDQVAQ